MKTVTSELLLLAGVVFIVLKLVGVVTWAWWVVLLPFIVIGAIWVLALITLLVIAVLGMVFRG